MAPALAAGGAVVLFAAPWVIPFVGPLATFFAPLPLGLLYQLKGPKAGRLGLLLAALGAFILTQFSAPLGGGYYLLYFFAMALVMGEAICLGFPEDWTVGGSAGASVVAVGILLMIGAMISDQGPWQIWQTQWSFELQMVKALYQDAGLDEASMKQLSLALEQFGKLIFHLAPGILASASLLVAWMNFLLIRRLGRRALAGMKVGDLTLYRSPEKLVWPLIVSAGLMVFTDGWLFWAGANLILVLGVVYFFQGMAVVAFWLKKKNAPPLLKTAIYVLVAVEFFLAILLAAVGLFDMWFNLRRLGKEPTA
jgi:uncharacterized protein YybS (DUF2232 family)